MRKLTLDLDALVVETFHTAAGGWRPGTVHGARAEGAYLFGSGDSDCPNCFSEAPCTNIPIATCTCGCPDTGPGSPPTPPVPVEPSGCAATSPCTCIPIETCSCAPGYGIN